MSSEPASGSNGASKKKQRRRDEDDDEDGGAPGSSDEEGIDLMNSDGDSSEEDDDDDAEEEARIREGFIADEDEDDGARERRKRRKHKKKKNREREFEALSEDDLDLVEQNTGVRIERPEGRKLKKLKRAGAASDDEDEEDSGDARAPDIANLFDDISSRARKDKGKRRAQERHAADDGDGDADGLGADLMEEDDMADFIEEDSPDEDGTGEVRDREARLARKQKERERRKKQKGGFSIGGLDMGAEAWGEIQEVFGDGHDYDDALESDEEDGKPAPRMQDVFEPSEIAERMMTDADDIIRATDIPERMQIAQTGISTHRTPPPPTVLEGEETPAEPESSDLLLFRSELGDAANWISTRISDDLTREYILTPDGHIPELRGVFVTAIQRVLQFLCEQCFEVPFIWMHRRDYFIHHDPTASNAANRERTLLDRDDLWKIYHLAIKYRAMLDRKANLLKLWGKLGIEEDEHFTDTFAQIESLEEAADLVEYVMVKHQRRLKDLAQAAGADIIAEDQDADAVRTASDGSKYKRATSGSRYEKAKDSLVARFAEQIAVPAEALAAGFEAGSKQAHIEDPPSAPEDFAEQFTDVTSLFADYDQVINAAKVILVHEISKEPILKKGVRTAFRTFGAVSVKPTGKGAQKVDDTHPYNAFKYLLDKPVDYFLQSTQFLQILDAESEGLVTVDIHIMKEPLRKLTQDFYTAYLSESTSEIGRAWNKVREDIVVEALQYHLLPMAARWTKDWLKETEEDWLAARCARALEDRVNQAPYDRDTQPKWPPGHAREAENVPVHPNPQPSDPKKNIPPKVMAISSGNGDRQRDWVETVVLAPKGRFAGREKYKEIRYRDSKHAMRLQILRTRPDVVVVGGFTANTHELRLDVQATLQLHDKEIQDRLDQKLADLRSIDRDVQGLEESDIKDALTDEQYQQMVTENWVHHLPVVFVNDEVARLYQNSERAQAEFAELSPVERYCVGLARHVQDPLCEYAALGNDITALSFDPDQRLISREKLLPILESAIVNIVNMTGVDINKAIREPNYRVLLPYVSGLGPRKASGMVRRITAASEGTLICRADLVKKEICTSRIFMNCVAFLRIPRENMEDEDDYDILDSTRIHSEDYHIARKMAGDAEEMDEEDLEDLPHPSAIVAQLMADDPQKLNELSLDDFAAALFETQQLQKRLTLYMIRDELQRPYSDPRQVYRIKAGEGAFTMLTGETRRSLEVHLVVPMVVTRIIKDERVVGRLDSGVTVEAVPPEVPVPMPFRVGQTIQALVTSLDINKFKIGVSLLPEHVAAADHTSLRKVQPDQFYDNIQASMDKQADEARNKRSQGRHRRVVNHPNFYNFNAGQAEQHLANLQRGDCVVRPSSRGTDHLAVTWKVDDGVYQHIDVLELDKQNEFSLGKSLRVQGKYTYSDLDELIVSYVRSMARKVDEMMHSDKYKGTEADLRKWLNTSIMAEPARSFYGFALDPRKPGNFILAFLTKGYEIQSWSISVEPEQFLLQGNSDPAPNVTMLCNAFKSMYMTRQAMLAGSGGGGGGAALGGRTPHLGGRTPNPAAGARTPAQTGTTPYGSRSPYVHRGAPPPQAHQMRPQTPQYMAQQQQHYQPPPPGPPAQPSGGAFMHPSRMQQAGFGR